MKTFTLDDVLSSGYCEAYDEEIIRRLWGERESATALDVLHSHIPPTDRIWLLFELDLLSEESLHTFRAALAHYGADICERHDPDDDSVRKCAEAWHALAQGQDVDIDAARLSAWYAAMAASSTYEIAAARAAAWAATRAASMAAARAAAWDAIISWLTISWLTDIVEVYEQ